MAGTGRRREMNEGKDKEQLLDYLDIFHSTQLFIINAIQELTSYLRFSYNNAANR
jgi:hypothetical protein